MKVSLIFVIFIIAAVADGFPESSPIDAVKIVPNIVGDVIKGAGTQAVNAVKIAGSTILHGAGDLFEKRKS